MRVSRLTSSRRVVVAATASVCTIASMLAAAHVDAQHAMTTGARAGANAYAAASDAVHDAPPFGTSLQIVPPGPRAEHGGMSYQMSLTWSALPGAVAYRVFVWTDAVRAWYRDTQTTGTRVGVHAFRSGCTAFIVVAVEDANGDGNALRGLEMTNVVRFPLSARPELCPVKPD